MNLENIKGSIVALVTPMKMDGSFDFPSLEKLINFHIQSKTDALVIAGTTGESATLNFDEHCELIQKSIELSQGKIPIIAGTGSNSTLEACELSRAAKKLGATASLSVTPYYNKPTQSGLIAHYLRIVEEVDLPTILYNVPSRTGVDLLPETVQEICKHPTIIGIKEAHHNPIRTKELRNTIDKAIFSGDDISFVESLKYGANGVISVTANIVPKIMAEIIESAFDGNWQEVDRLNATISSLHTNLFVESNPIPVKWALSKMKLIENNLRLPLTPLASEFHEGLSKNICNI